MSLFPLKTIDAIRQHIDTVIEVYGIPCKVYIPENIAQRESLDIYDERPRLVYSKVVGTKVWIEWQPDAKRLRKLGIFVEEQVPIIAWFKGIQDLQRNAYFKIDIRLIPEGLPTVERYELVDRLIRKVYTSIVMECWKVVPLREVPEEERE